MTAEELARQAGTTSQRIERMAELRILEPRDEADPFRPEDIHRVRFVEALDAADISLEDMARLVKAGKYSFGYIEGVFMGTGWPLLDRTFAEVAEEVGLPWDAVQQLYGNWGLPPPEPDQQVREDDLIALRERAEVQEAAGMDVETLIAASRFFGDNLRRMVAAQVRFFRENVMLPMLASGRSHMEMLEAIGPLSRTMQEYSGGLRDWLYERHLETQIFQEAIESAEAALADAGYARARSERIPAIAFLDLAGFTRLTEDAGDAAAADLAERLMRLVGRAARDFGGETVKLLGDGVMFHFSSPAGAVSGGLELIQSAEREGLPPARVGLHAGPVVFRDGDYFGQTVNLAARITDYARPREVLVSTPVVKAAADGEFGFEPIGEIALRGVLDPIPLFRARHRHSSAEG